MTFIYRIIVIVSAFIVIVIGGSWLGHKFNLGLDVSWWEPVTIASYYERAREDDGVPATEPGEVSVPIEPSFGRQPWTFSIDETQILPVSYGRDAFLGFTASGYGAAGGYRSGGKCFEKVVNLLIINETSPEGAPVFKSRVYLPRYFYFAEEEVQTVAALVIERDTNQDGKLDCGDEASFELRSLNDGQIRRADRVFIPDNISDVTYSNRERAFTFAEVSYQGDQIASMKNIKIMREDLAISETVAPDLISKANAAFAITAEN